ncbi:hypothetical protein RQP46_011448 [Phenoliferia psychrophenolica]
MHFSPLLSLFALVASVVSTPLPIAALPSFAAAQNATVLEARGSSYSGRGTYYNQGGVRGSCGTISTDKSLVIALSQTQSAGGSHCGKMVKITNTANGKSVTAKVMDECPGCGWGSLDLSVAAFNKIGKQSTGVLPIKWTFA